MGWFALAGCALLLLSTAALSHGPAREADPGLVAELGAEEPGIPAPRPAPDAPLAGAHRTGRDRRAADR
jgi:hypothetical protein